MRVRIDTALGRLEGREEHGIRSFRGIPYAAAPVGKLRWRPPERPTAWTGVRPAHRFGSSAPQMGPASRWIRALIGAAANEQSEDCLTLNVWSPGSPGPPRPVMVWIHGGAFVMGSGATRLYAGSRLAKRGDLVVVSLNYRLGALGFLHAAALASGHEPPVANLGIRDQIAALEWIRDHIEAFGGDPGQVTLFGESAGAMSIGTLLGIPRARGLFQRAILQSGAAHNVSRLERSTQVAEVFLRELGLPRPDPDRLARQSLDDVLRAQLAATRRLGLVDGRLPWQPAIDGDLIARPPLEEIAAGLSNEVSTLVGTNRDEWKLFMLGDRRGRRLDEAGWQRRLDRTLSLCVADAEARRMWVRRADETYRDLEGERSHLSPAERWCAFQSDRIFHFPAAELARRQVAAGAPTWSYRFDWMPPVVRERVGASERIQDGWIQFARTGSPGHPRLPTWPEYGPGRRTMLLDRECRLRDDWLHRETAFWEALP